MANRDSTLEVSIVSLNTIRIGVVVCASPLGSIVVTPTPAWSPASMTPTIAASNMIIVAPMPRSARSRLTRALPGDNIRAMLRTVGYYSTEVDHGQYLYPIFVG